jgi:hypothetical protein
LIAQRWLALTSAHAGPEGDPHSDGRALFRAVPRAPQQLLLLRTSNKSTGAMSCATSTVALHAGIAPPPGEARRCSPAASCSAALLPNGRAARLQLAAGRPAGRGQLAAARRNVVTRAAAAEEKVSHVLDVRARARESARAHE